MRERIAEAASLMLCFAERTGLSSERAQRRYLWTDAFAVCNFLTLAGATGEERYGDLALGLVEQVHQVLGQHRADDRRSGWISGLAEREGELHPTRAGLRIGKELPERPRGSPFDERLEWNRDGQYFHYLTKWMHALDQVSRSTGQPRFNAWARELAEAAHCAFANGSAGRGRPMAWKMSIDLSRPLVPSMGHHDPLDGFITCIQLQATASTLKGAPTEPDLKDAVADFETLIQNRNWTTADPLGLGGLLIDSCRVYQLMRDAHFAGADLLDTLLSEALEGLSHYAREDRLRIPASRRLAFRELGLAIGISAIERLHHYAGGAPSSLSIHSGTPKRIEMLSGYRKLGLAIESFWRNAEHRQYATWAEHRDINEVMLATCLAPDGMLRLEPLA